MASSRNRHDLSGRVFGLWQQFTVIANGPRYDIELPCGRIQQGNDECAR
jgi:hypothetical protein